MNEIKQVLNIKCYNFFEKMKWMRSIYNIILGIYFFNI